MHLGYVLLVNMAALVGSPVTASQVHGVSTDAKSCVIKSDHKRKLLQKSDEKLFKKMDSTVDTEALDQRSLMGARYYMQEFRYFLTQNNEGYAISIVSYDVNANVDALSIDESLPSIKNPSRITQEFLTSYNAYYYTSYYYVYSFSIDDRTFKEIASKPDESFVVRIGINGKEPAESGLCGIRVYPKEFSFFERYVASKVEDAATTK